MPLGASGEGLRVKGQLCYIAPRLGFPPLLEHRALYCQVPAGSFLGKTNCGFVKTFLSQRGLGYQNTILGREGLSMFSDLRPMVRSGLR